MLSTGMDSVHKMQKKINLTYAIFINSTAYFKINIKIFIDFFGYNLAFKELSLCLQHFFKLERKHLISQKNC